MMTKQNITGSTKEDAHLGVAKEQAEGEDEDRQMSLF